MTRERLLKAIRYGLRGSRSDPDMDKLASSVLQAVEMALHLDEEEEVRVVMPVEAPKQAFADLPLSRAVAPAASLIIAPDSQEAKEVLAAKAGTGGIKPPTIGTSAVQDTTPRWTIPDLNNTLYGATPETIEFFVDFYDEGKGRQRHEPVTLRRNIIVGPGFDAVKVCYKDDRVADDSLEVSETFFTFQEEIDVEGALERINVNARKMYSPKKKGIVSTTPIREGQMASLSPIAPNRFGNEGLATTSLRFDSSTPHSDV